MATALAAIDGRAAAMSFQADPVTGQELTVGQRRVAAFLHALGCERTGVQAVPGRCSRPPTCSKPAWTRAPVRC